MVQIWYKNGHMLKNSTPEFIVIRYLIADIRYLNRIEFGFCRTAQIIGNQLVASDYFPMQNVD